MEQGTPTNLDTTKNYNELSKEDFFKSHVIKDDSGYHLPTNAKDVLAPLNFDLMNTEARRRTTEANLSKEVNGRLDLEAKLKTQSEFMSLPSLPSEEQAELESLKYTDPDEWLVQVTKAKAKVEGDFKEKFDASFAANKATITEQATKLTVEQQLATFNTASENKLTQEMLDYDVPPRLHKQLADGKINYNEFLAQASDIVHGKKVVATNQSQTEPTFNGTPNGNDANSTQTQTFADVYANAKF